MKSKLSIIKILLWCEIGMNNKNIQTLKNSIAII